MYAVCFFETLAFNWILFFVADSAVEKKKKKKRKMKQEDDEDNLNVSQVSTGEGQA